jgi:2-dehydropantoate 2-reductase
VTLIARGSHLEAIRRQGLKVIGPSGEFIVRPKATDDPKEAGPQDFVIVALKAHAVAPVAEAISALFGPRTAVAMAVNGVPWWYFHGAEGALKDRRLPIVDPGDKQWRAIGPERVMGCVVYPAAEIASPGVIRHIEGDRFTLGEPDGSKSERVQALAKALIAGGLRAPIKTDIRTEIWVKLLGNVAFNPLTALTGATLKQLCEDRATRAIAHEMMAEAEAVAGRLGVKLPISIERRIDGARQVGDHKTSMLQDFERGRPIELDALVGAVIELGRMVDCPTPTIETIYALTRSKARLAGLYPG